jgi:hypothetical protein
MLHRTTVVMAGSLWLAVCGTGSANAQDSALELLQYCTALERGAQFGPSREIKMPDSRDVHFCWGYMRAMQNVSVITVDGVNTLLHTCVSADATLLQLIYVFNKYARNHPEELHKPPASVVLNAFWEAFPCRLTGAR